jgi:hypothetical protein
MKENMDYILKPKKELMITADLYDIHWSDTATTLPDSCRVRLTMKIPWHYDTPSKHDLDKAIIDDLETRYHAKPEDYSVRVSNYDIIQPDSQGEEHD